MFPPVTPSGPPMTIGTVARIAAPVAVGAAVGAIVPRLAGQEGWTAAGLTLAPIVGSVLIGSRFGGATGQAVAATLALGGIGVAAGAVGRLLFDS